MSAVGEAVVVVTVVVGAARSMLDVGWPVAKESDPVEVSESCEDPQPTKASVATTKVNAICFFIDRTVPQMRVKARKNTAAEPFYLPRPAFAIWTAMSASFADQTAVETLQSVWNTVAVITRRSFCNSATERQANGVSRVSNSAR